LIVSLFALKFFETITASKDSYSHGNYGSREHRPMGFVIFSINLF